MRSTTNLSSDLQLYYEQKLLLQAYDGDERRMRYEQAYWQSTMYTRFMKQVKALNVSGRSYTDKRTRGYKYYVSHKDEVRKQYERRHPVPPTVKPSGKVVFHRSVSWDT